ncbi:hypothetical protein TNCV_136451 [Trichonephila clavipes]|nr:hypothetical protein TNCV_136451 [Trichonephila clavipes]
MQARPFEIVNGVLSADTVIAKYVPFLIRRFRSGIFAVKDAPRTGRPLVEIVDKITEIIEVYRHVSSRSIAQKLKINYKTKPFEQSWIQKEAQCLAATPNNTKKHNESNFHLESPGQTEENRPLS